MTVRRRALLAAPLLGLDLSLRPQPQMAERAEPSEDGRTGVFTLRDGLVFHDNEPVRPAGCIACFLPQTMAMSHVAQDQLSRAGLRVDFQTMDWGTMPSRMAKREPVEQGGWSCFCTTRAGLSVATPGTRARAEAGLQTPMCPPMARIG